MWRAHLFKRSDWYSIIIICISSGRKSCLEFQCDSKIILPLWGFVGSLNPEILKVALLYAGWDPFIYYWVDVISIGTLELFRFRSEKGNRYYHSQFTFCVIKLGFPNSIEKCRLLSFKRNTWKEYQWPKLAIEHYMIFARLFLGTRWHNFSFSILRGKSSRMIRLRLYSTLNDHSHRR